MRKILGGLGLIVALSGCSSVTPKCTVEYYQELASGINCDSKLEARTFKKEEILRFCHENVSPEFVKKYGCIRRENNYMFSAEEIISLSKQETPK